MVQSPYRERILDHHRNPRHRGHLKAPQRTGEADNPVCGDVVQIELRLDADGRVREAAFDGQGCVIAIAAASMLTEYVHGRGLEELRKLTDADVLGMLEADLSRTRTQCALVSLQALKKALE